MKKLVVALLAVVMIIASASVLTACSKEEKWIGFDTEFAEAVGAEMGIKVIFKEIDWDNKEFELNSKAIDCIWNGFTVTPARAAELEFTNSYMKNMQSVVIKTADADKYTTTESLKTAKLTAEAGSAGQDAIEDDENLSQAVFNSVQAQTDALLELISGTSDAAIIDFVMASSYVGKGDYANLMIVSTISLAYEEYAIGFRKGSAMAEKLNEVMIKLYNDGTLTELAKKYDIAPQLLDLSATAAAEYDANNTDLKYVTEKGTLVIGITNFEPMNYKESK